MNFAILSFIIGFILQFEALFLLLPWIVGMIYGEYHVALIYLATAVVCFILGKLLSFRHTGRFKELYVREGFTAVALGWFVMSVFGAIPFVLTGEIPFYIDALFETISGFTTTGSSILSDVEALSYASLFWRSFTHWIGGMGVFVFIMAILPMMGGSTMNLMRAESPGPSVSKLVPRVRDTAKILYGLYMAITVLGVIMLCLCGMPLFDSLCTTFGSVGTGGFGVKNSSIGGYSPLIQNAVTVLMILSGVNYTVYFCLLSRQFKEAFSIEEVRWYFLIIFASALMIAWNIRPLYATLGETLRHSFFQVGTIITTTGFATTDFNMWPQLSKTILLLLMMIGACAGSTTGGIKCIRMVILFQVVKNEFKHILHPNAVLPVRVNKQVIPPSIQSTVLAFTFLYAVIAIISILIMMGLGVGFLESIGTVISSMGNMGPGLGTCGPAFSWSELPDAAKWLLSFLMLLGRLELFTVLLLFTSDFWKKN